ncbi:ankyrin repeat-containing domain protein [Dendryphion nanum]|uniref:Ankyrin repeat-containing domain protein n=1 Tax=Dendryphion nanum TaxID=256645 RepID=A0A9P9DGZ2_9PLEO|nr:ankyrin repeat-containing domain protein [Dendryphion nanum]
MYVFSISQFMHVESSALKVSTFNPHHQAYHPSSPSQANPSLPRIDVERRLRRAILLNDLTLVKRIIRNNPSTLRNPDFDDKSNTSLHIAAKHGFTQIAEFLIESGHETDIVSRNNDWETPLMLAAVAGKEELGTILAKRFPECIPYQNKNGLDALMLSCKSGTGTLHLIPTLLNLSPQILTAVDRDGNGALHYASAAGELKALRMLLQMGANPLAQNAYSWTPVHYSATPAAEAYFKTLIIEFEKKKAEDAREKKERERQRNAGVRLVTNEDVIGGVQNASDRQRARDDAAIAGLPAPGMEWSPVERRRAMTPTEGRTGWFGGDANRPRAGSGG